MVIVEICLGKDDRILRYRALLFYNKPRALFVK